jgi:hypothetical protein
MNMHYWIITDKKGNLIGLDSIGLDSNSGGYPFATKDLRAAKLWTDKEDAELYVKRVSYGTGAAHGYEVRELFARVE